MPLTIAMTHPVAGLLPPLKMMQGEGYAAEACLKGTGLQVQQLNEPARSVTLQQEVRFYRNLLELTGDAAIGLRLGAAFVPQRYGIFGYALLSAATLGHAVNMAAHFVALSFSWFELAYSVRQGSVLLTLSDRLQIEADVRNLLHDRDCAAVWVDLGEMLGQRLPLERVTLPHDGHRREAVYRDFFGCPVAFGGMPSSLQFNAGFLDQPLPHHDAVASEQLRQQCQLLLARMTRQNPLVQQVRQLLLSHPGRFAEVSVIAEQIGMSERSLRRHLTEENTSYKEILDEVRFSLARQYLSETSLPLQEIAVLLGYTEPGNFTHAFKRWAGISPRLFRDEVRGLAKG
ncbi:AraC family transcriptional regulator [Pseudomonas sp. N040]|uniref:AraC family transcriptional regulator n=1 Tax=Pseudomonas sp. N040 TaxID=2785325 RepID=UPI0018A2F156|nr:AraC family transcriptional regulator [Pseudomonas sp. N040]MBF7729078.1 AraC family transcriptional regulator [Pseudomonas sp. N040]MBW7012718.1 AraC family transcriptional regulator [Pseudomonas sp. N040]